MPDDASARKPDPYDDTDSHRALSCYSCEDCRCDVVHGSSPTRFVPRHTPPYHITPLGVVPGLGSRLSPVHFHCPHSREVRCYALLREWLLPSLSPSCLRAWTYFVFTFGRHLGTLTRISIVLVSAQSLTAWRPFLRVYTGWHFGVCE